MKRLVPFILALLLFSCGVTVNYDYQKGTDFTKYKTYHYFDNMETGLSELDAKRLFRVLNEALESEGLSMSNSPDFLIDIKSSYFEDTHSGTSVGFGVGTVGGGISVGVPVGQANVSRQIIFDFVDAQTEQLIWQAASKEPHMPENTPEAREAQFKMVVEKVLQGFPPKQ